MQERTLSEYLNLLVAMTGRDETSVVAEAIRSGVEILYREALAEGYLLGKVPREVVLRELGPERLWEVEHQQDALRPVNPILCRHVISLERYPDPGTETP